MTYQILNSKDARILTAMAGGIIPRGERSTKLDAAGLADQWLPRTDCLLAGLPWHSRTGLRAAMRILNRLCPIFFLHSPRPFSGMTRQERSALFYKIENDGLLGLATVLLAKYLVFPAFYDLKEVREAIDRRENSPG